MYVYMHVCIMCRCETWGPEKRASCLTAHYKVPAQGRAALELQSCFALGCLH